MIAISRHSLSVEQNSGCHFVHHGKISRDLKMKDQILRYGVQKSIETCLRICWFMASEIFTVKYNAIYGWKVCLMGHRSSYNNCAWAMARVFKCVCDRFQFV